LVRVLYSGLTQSVFRVDRVKSSSCDCPEKIPVDVYSNASCFTWFSSGSSSPEGVDFFPSLLTITINRCKLFLFSCFGRLNLKDCLKLVTYRLNTLSGDPVSRCQIFYLFCKELRFGDVHSHPSV
jgi:hypothetical protein